MKQARLILIPIFIMFFLNAYADNRPGAFTLTAGGGYYYFTDQRHVENTGLPTFALSYNLNDHWAVEGMYGVINTEQTSDAGGDHVHGNLFLIDGIYRFPSYHVFDPYILVGIGVLGLKPSGTQPTQQGNVNAGIGAQVFLDHSIALRVEARDLYTTTSSGKNEIMVDAGISILVGGEAKESVVSLK